MVPTAEPTAPKGRSLHAAASAGNLVMAELLLAHGADPNLTTYDGATPLMAVAGVNWVVAQTYSRSDAEYLEAAALCLDLGDDEP